jgi:hypothetical protein
VVVGVCGVDKEYDEDGEEEVRLQETWYELI